MIVILLISILWARVIAESGVESAALTTPNSSTLDVPYEELPSIHDGQYLYGNDESVDFPDESAREENPSVDKRPKNISEDHHQNDQPVQSDDVDLNQGITTETDEEAYKDADDEDLLETENGTKTANSETFDNTFGETADDSRNGSMNETADDIFDMMENETANGVFDSLNNETFDDVFGEFNQSNPETAEDIFGEPENGGFNVSKHDVFKEVSNKSVEDIFNVTANGSALPFNSNSNYSGILQAWLAEQTTKPTLVAGEPLFTSTSLDGDGEVCVSLNISMRLSLNNTPLVLSSDYASENSVLENKGRITLYAVDEEANNNATFEFLVNCGQQSCSLKLDILNMNSHQGIKPLNQDEELCRANLSTTFEDFKEKTLKMTNGVQLRIGYISFFVAKKCSNALSSGSCISRYYAEILYGLGIGVVIVCIALFVYWKIQRKKKTSFNTI